MKNPSRRFRLLLLSFLLPAAVMAAVLALGGLAPFGGRTMGVMDMSHQYIAFLASLRDILAGRASLYYLPSMCLGGNMFGVFAYYLVSPLDLLVCLFPRGRLYDAVGLLYILRVGLCGLTMAVYAGGRRGYAPRVLIPAFAYALMAYMTAYSFNYLWQDGVILLPLVALGIARLAEADGSPWLYVVSLAAALALNFYIGYILCLFSVLFFLAELISATRSDKGKTLRRFVLSSLAAGGLAAAVLLPAFLSLRTGKAGFSLSSFSLELRYSLPQLLSKLFPDAFRYEEIMPEGAPQLFTGTVTAALAVLYFANRAVPPRRRLLTGGLMLILAGSMLISALDLVWHGFNLPTWYNARYSFLWSFLLAAAADQELAELRTGTRLGHLLLPVGVVAGVSALTFAGQSYPYASWTNAGIAAGMTAAAMVLLAVLRKPETGKRLAAVLCAALFLLHAGELAQSAGHTFASLYAQASDKNAFAAYAEAKADALALLPTEYELVRTESTDSFDMDRCEPMLFGYDGLSHYGSTLSQASLDLLDRMGLDRYEALWVQYGPGVTAAADTILGVRYLVTGGEAKGYAVLGQTDAYTVLRNDNALPIAWTADEAIADPIAAEDSFGYLNALYAAAAPEVRADVFTSAEAQVTELSNFVRNGDRFTRVETAPASVTYTVSVRADGPLYAELDIPDWPGVMLFADGTLRAWYATAQTNGTVYLGDCRAGDAVTVTLQASADMTVAHAAFSTENADALAAYASVLKTGGCGLTRINAAHYIGHFSAPAEDGLLVFTLPYDSSWRITLDGQRVTPSSVQEGLMALAVTPGAHTVELRYVPAGLLAGAVISILTLAACLVVRRRTKT